MRVFQRVGMPAVWEVLQRPSGLGSWVGVLELSGSSPVISPLVVLFGGELYHGFRHFVKLRIHAFMLNFQDRLGMPGDGDQRTPFEVLSDFELCIADVLSSEVEPSNYQARTKSTWLDPYGCVDFQCLPPEFIQKMLSRASAHELANLFLESQEIFGRLNRHEHAARCAALLIGQDDFAFDLRDELRALHARSRAFERNEFLAAARRVAPLARAVAPLVLSSLSLVTAWTVVSKRLRCDQRKLEHDLETLLWNVDKQVAQHAQLRAVATSDLFSPASQVLDAMDRQPDASHLAEAQLVLAKYRLDPAGKDPL